MDGVVRITVQDSSVLLEGIFGESMKVEGRLTKVDIMAQTPILSRIKIPAELRKVNQVVSHHVDFV